MGIHEDVGAATRERRPVLIQTLHETITGNLVISNMLRTLDDLNLVAPKFLTIEVEKTSSEGWFFDQGRVGINTSSILFVKELTEFQRGGKRVEAARFSRSAVRLRMGEFEVQGFMHVPGRGDPMSRLNQDKRPFLAITSASVIGPGLEFAAPFLAVNRLHISAAQEMSQDATEMEDDLVATEIG